MAKAFLFLFLSFHYVVSSQNYERNNFRSNLSNSTNLIAMVEIQKKDGNREKLCSGIILGRRRGLILIASANHSFKGKSQEDKILVRFKNTGLNNYFDANLKESFELDYSLLEVSIPEEFRNEFCLLSLNQLGGLKNLGNGDRVYAIGYAPDDPWSTSLNQERFKKVEENIIKFESYYVSHGFSGGGLTDENGLLIGMIFRTNSNISKAYDLNHLLNIANKKGYETNLEKTLPNGLTPLHLAAKKEDVRLTKKYLNECPQVNKKDDLGATALHYAAKQNSSEILSILLEFGFSSKIFDNGNQLPIHWAIKEGNLIATKILMGLDRSYYLKSEIGHILLLKAIDSRQPKIVSYLLQQQLYLDGYEGTNNTLLHRLIQNDQKEIIKSILRFGANPNIRNEIGLSPLSYCLVNGKTNISKILMDFGAILTLDYLDSSILANFLCEGEIETIEELLNQGADVNCLSKENLSAFMCSVKKGDVERMELLIRYGANVKTDDAVGGLMSALTSKRQKVAAVLIREGVKSDNNASEEIRMAINRGYEIVILAWLDAGNNPFIRGWDSRPLLYSAFDPYQPNIVKAFASRGHNVNSRDSNGNALLHILFAGWNHGIAPTTEALKNILIEGADINAKNKNGNKPIDMIQSWDGGQTRNRINKLLNQLQSDKPKE